MSANLKGRQFGRLNVMYKLGSAADGSGTIWRCKCACGAYVKVRQRSLVVGSTKSCGCLLREYRRWQEGGEQGAAISDGEVQEAEDATYEDALRAINKLIGRFGEPAIRRAVREVAHRKRMETVS